MQNRVGNSSKLGVVVKRERLPLFLRVRVKELDATGCIYESAIPIGGGDRVYGVRLDKVAFPKNFIATTVWHCEADKLEEISK